MMQKIAEFVRVHGLSWKSFFVSMIVCPPAAAYIAYRKPGIGVVQRVALGTLGLMTAPALTAVITYAAARLVIFFAAD